MAPERKRELEQLRDVPGSVADAAGYPAFGTYRGGLAEVDLRRLSGRYGLSRSLRLLKQKRWQFVLVATPEVAAVFAIMDLSYSTGAFVTAVDLPRRKVLFDGSYLGPPGPLGSVGDRPGEGLSARFLSPGAYLSCARAMGSERYTQNIAAWKPPLGGRLRWKGEVLAAGGPPALTVISPLSGDGVVNVTQKWAGLLGFGTLSAGGRTYSLDGGVAGLDYSQGYLARHTTWRWAMGVGRMPDGTALGLNLAEGINDETDEVNENALWIGPRLVPLSRARFDFNRQDALDEWRVHTTGGEVELRFRPLFAHREARNLLLVRSRFTQPIGTFTGRLTLDGQELPVSLTGVTEEQDVLW